MHNYNPSINIVRDSKQTTNYIPTQNAQLVFEQISKDFSKGVRSFNIIGAYGTGKSHFLWAFQKQVNEQASYFKTEKELPEFEFLNVVGKYESIIENFAINTKIKKVDYTSDDILNQINILYKKAENKGNGLAIIIDEFGKFLEFVAQNKPEEELYFIQQIAELANDTTKKILFISTLHQDFNAYAFKLSKAQKDEWSKVKGRLKEATFNEPVEQLLLLASERVEQLDLVENRVEQPIDKLLNAIIEAKVFPLRDYCNEIVTRKLLPFDILSASILTLALQKYGQNERSLFSFIDANDYLALHNFPKDNKHYNLACVYDYLIYNFYALLSSKYNPHFAQWASIKVALERAEAHFDKDLKETQKIIKTIGLLNIFANASASVDSKFLSIYAQESLGFQSAELIIHRLENKFKIIRFLKHSSKYILFEGTDLDIEKAIEKAYVDDNINILNSVKQYVSFPYLMAKANFFKYGTPRYFQFVLSDELIADKPVAEIDGFINLIISKKVSAEDVKEFSSKNGTSATLYGHFSNYESIKNTIIEIEKIKKVKFENADDKIALRELDKILEFQKSLILELIESELYRKKSEINWYYNGEKIEIDSRKTLNIQLSKIADLTYSLTPNFQSELVNKTKLSTSIATARRSIIRRLVSSWREENLGFSADQFPPEKTIYLSLLKKTGIHYNSISSCEFRKPTDETFIPLWNECENFLNSTKTTNRKVSELYEILSSGSFKLKKGFLDFWIPIYLFIKRNDLALFDKDVYVPTINDETLELVARKPSAFSLKAFDIDGVKLDIFNGYRSLINQTNEDNLGTASFIETIKPFLIFYKQLPEYAKKTNRLSENAIALRKAILKAKFPEKTFFEDFPAALGFNTTDLQQEEVLKSFIANLQEAIRELRTSFDEFINRIENFINLEILDAKEIAFPNNKKELQNRFLDINKHLLLPKQKVFFNAIFTKLDERESWFSALIQALTGKSMSNLKDDDEPKIYNILKKMVVALDNLRDISNEVSSKKIDVNKETVLKINLSSTENETKHRIISFKKNGRTRKLESSIKKVLTDDKDENIEILLKLLHEQLNDEQQS